MALTTIIPNTTLPFVKPQSVSHLSNGISTDINGVQFPLQKGVPIQNVYTFKVIPVADSANCVAPAQSFGSGAAGGNLRLQTTVQGSAPNIFSKPIIFLGQQGVLLDCERAVTINFSVATLAATVVTIKGYDYRGMAAQWTSPTYAIGSTSIATIFPFSIITSVNFSTNPFSGNATPTIAIGNSNYIGLPYLLKNTSYVTYSIWNNATLASVGGSVVAGYNWRALNGYASTTTPRGYVNLGTTSVPDGAKILVVTYYVYGADSELNAEVNNLNQSSLKIINAKHTNSSTDANPVWVLPYLVSEDLTGLQLDPGIIVANNVGPDADFFIAYNDAIAA